MIELMKELAEGRPLESELVPHEVMVSELPSSLLGVCLCGWSFQSMGRDESSRSAVRAAVERHKS